MVMDLGQLVVAIIGATSTLLAALLSSRSRTKPGVVPSKKSARRSLIKFGFYFILGGVATYWVMSWLMPSRVEGNQMKVLEPTSSQFNRSGIAFAQGLDTMHPPSLPVGSVLLSVLPPDGFGRLPGGSSYWAIADGSVVDSSTAYAMLTGNTNLPDFRRSAPARVDTSATDSSLQTSAPNGVETNTVYWYIRIN
jgi:hypothetical protein